VDGGHLDGPRLRDGRGDGASPASCLSSWCWERPLPHGNRYNAVWGSSATDVFAVGAAGTISRYDGASWTQMASGTTATLHGVWGSGASNVYAVGEGGALLRYDGAQWSALPSGTASTLRGVWGSGPADIFVVGGAESGQTATVLRYSGSWAPAVAGLPATSAILFAVRGRGPTDDVYAVGPQTVYRFSRSTSTWSAAHTLPAPITTASLWVSPAGDVFVGDHLDKVWRYSAASGSWTSSWPGVWGPLIMWGFSSSEVYAMGQNSLARFDGAAWNTIASTTATMDLRGLWGSSPKDLFLAGGGGSLLHFNGASIDQHLPKAAVTQKHLNAVWGRSDNDFFVVGAAGTILRYDGAKWAAQVSPTTVDLHGVWGGSSRVYAVGDEGTILAYDGAKWTLLPSPSKAQLAAVWGATENDIHIVGGDVQTTPHSPVILRYSGTTTAVALPSAEGALFSISGSAANNIYAVGEKALALRFDGNTWTKVALPIVSPTEPLRGAWARGAADVFIACPWGYVYHFDGASWSKSSVSWAGALWGDSGRLFSVGELGNSSSLGSGGWARVETGCGNNLAGIWGSGKTVLAVGGTGTILRLGLP
jgi:hypothetical protein